MELGMYACHCGLKTYPHMFSFDFDKFPLHFLLFTLQFFHVFLKSIMSDTKKKNTYSIYLLMWLLLTSLQYFIHGLNMFFYL